jgi:hypothetical protein
MCDALCSLIVLSESLLWSYRDIWSKVFSQGTGSAQQQQVSLQAMTAWDLRQRHQHLPPGKKVCFKDLAIGKLRSSLP